MSRPTQRMLTILLAVVGAGVVAQDEVRVGDQKKLPSFKLTMPGTVEVPVEKGPKIAENAPVLKQKSFFGPGSETKVITMSEAVQSALRNNLDAKVEEVGVLLEEARLRNAYGEFDPVFSFSFSRSGSETPDSRNNVSSADAVAQLAQIQAQIDAINANTIANQEFTNAVLQALGRPTQTFDTQPLSTDLTSEGTVIFDQDVDRGEMSLQARSPIGTVIRASARSTRVRNTFAGDTRVITPTYTVTSGFEARQPLLKDFGFDANLADVRISRKNKQAQVLTWRFKLEATLQDVVSTYYDLLLGIADLENKGDAITAGLKLVAYSERRRELGFLSPYEVQQAQVQLSFDRENLLLAKNFFLTRQYEMQRLILSDYQEGKTRIFLPSAMPSLRIPKLDADALLDVAFEHRLDYKAALAVAEAEDVRVKFAKNQRKPQLDIVGGYNWTGLDNGYQGALNNMTHSQAPGWQLGITGSFPLGGIQPRAQLDAAQARKQQAVLRVQTAQLEVGVGVHQVIELIRTNKERVATAELTTKVAEDAVRAGFGRLEQGLISNLDLIEQQRRLYDARSRELSARAELNKSITRLWLATGTVLENLGVSYDEDDKAAGAKRRVAPEPVKPVVVKPAPAKKKGR